MSDCFSLNTEKEPPASLHVALLHYISFNHHHLRLERLLRCRFLPSLSAHLNTTNIGNININNQSICFSFLRIPGGYLSITSTKKILLLNPPRFIAFSALTDSSSSSVYPRAIAAARTSSRISASSSIF